MTEQELSAFKTQILIWGYSVTTPNRKNLTLAQLRDRVMSGQLAVMAENGNYIQGWWD